jgi:iron complex outermembrane receptor protein
MASYTWLLWNGGVTANMQYNAFGRVYFVASNLPIDSQGDYGLLAASIGYQPSHANWRVSLWGKNLTDTGYYTTIGAVGPVTAGHPGDPRTFGIKIAWSM